MNESSRANELASKTLYCLVLAVGTVLVVSTIGCSSPEQEAKITELKAQREFEAQTKQMVALNQAQIQLEAKNEDEKARNDCLATLEDRKATFQKLFSLGKYLEAATTVRDCARIMHDQSLHALLSKAEVRNYIALIKDKKTDPLSRVDTLNLFTKEYPDEAKPFQPMRIELVEINARQVQAAELVERKANASRRKKVGVSIGMSQEEVIASSWGKPHSVHRTTSSFGTHEQWVYGSRNYLYFENGVLTTIQN